MKAMARQRFHSIEFKRQVAQEFIAGESLYALSKRHDISRQLIRVWVQKYEAGALDEDAQAADLLQEYEAKIAALERMVGRQALEIEFLKGALKNAPRPRNVNTSVIAGPHSIEFKRQVAQEFIAGESLYALSKRHDISRQLIRVWVQKYEAGALDEDAQA